MEERHQEREERFSALERRALAAWSAAAPPPGFAERLLAAGQIPSSREVPLGSTARRSGGVAPALRSLAAAAVTLLALGGLLSLRAGAPSAGGGALDDRSSAAAAYVGQDAGPRPDVPAALAEAGM